MSNNFSWNIHRSVYKLAHGDMNVEWLLRTWPLLRHYHRDYPEDILQLDLSRIPFLFDEKKRLRKDRLDRNDEFWSEDIPYPINAITKDEAIWEFVDDPQRKHILVQTREEIAVILKSRDANNIAVATQYLFGSEEKHVAVMVVFQYRITDKEGFITVEPLL
jgi:hypothetical protein